MTGGFTIRSGVPYQADSCTVVPPKTSRGSTGVLEAHGLPRTHIPHGWINNPYVYRPMGLANRGQSTFGGYYRMVRPEGSGNPYGIGPGRNWKKTGGLGGDILWAAGPD